MTRELRVLDPGPGTTVQDPGRPGLAHLGVPRSGWLDPPAATLANRLVGNATSAAVLECVLGGLRLTVPTALTLALTGARCPATVDGRAVAHAVALTVPAGAVVALGAPVAGVRTYVALAGGVAVPPVLGSRATDTLSGLGPRPLATGDVLPVGPPQGEPSGAEGLPLPDTPGAPVTLRCTPGPRADWFVSGAAALAASAYDVARDSDRVGMRLSGPALRRSREGELPSEGLVLGSVQVSSDGQPLVFLADHPTTGGYPVVAVVVAEDVARCAQLRPGERVGFSLLPGG